MQDIFDNLPDLSETKTEVTSGRIEFEIENIEDDNDEYRKIVVKLTNYFAPKQNISYERHMFPKMSQGKNERIDSCILEKHGCKSV